MRGFLKRLIFGKREHNDRLVAFARDNDRRVVFTNAVDRVGKIFSRFSVGDRLHNMDRILSILRVRKAGHNAAAATFRLPSGICGRGRGRRR